MALESTSGGGGSSAVTLVTPTGTSAHPRMAFVSVKSGARIEVPLGPQEVTLDGIAPTWVEIDRDARSPLLVRSAGSLRKLAMTLDVAYDDAKPIADVLDALQLIADVPPTVDGTLHVSYDASIAGIAWHITAMSIKVTARQHGSNEPTQATVDVALTEASTANIKIGPVAGLATATRATTGTKTGNTSSGTGILTTGQDKLPTQRSVSGSLAGEGARNGNNPTRRADFIFLWPRFETAQAFALRVTGDASNWKVILDYNKVANIIGHPDMQLKVPYQMIPPSKRLLNGAKAALW